MARVTSFAAGAQFTTDEFAEFQITDAAGEPLGALRVTPNKVLWKPQGGEAFRERTIAELKDWISAGPPPLPVRMPPIQVREVHSFDWAGAGGHAQPQPGIALASGAPGAIPQIRCPLSRTQALSEIYGLAQRATEEGTILVGLDFAFSFPWEAKGHRFPDGSTDRQQFWVNVAATIWPQGTAQDYVLANVEHFQWYDQVNRVLRTGNQYLAAHRLTEQVAPGQPASVFNLIGANQVGKGSLCGIAMLQVLSSQCSANHIPLIVWPFFYLDANGVYHNIPTAGYPEKCLIIIETYPSLHWQEVLGGRGNNYQDPAAWQTIRTSYQANQAAIPRMPTQDEGDALITWYALSSQGMNFLLHPSQAFTNAPANVVGQEGWIFGV